MEIIYLYVGVFVLIINVIPAFMPPTWLVLAFLYTNYHLNLIPTVIIGVVSATIGRIILYHLSKTYFKRFFPKKMLGNYDALGKFLHKNQHFTLPVVLTYTFFPVSSNYVFIVAGLSNLNVGIITVAFVIGRLISYTFWISASHRLSTHLETIFSEHISQGATLLLEIIGLLAIYLIGKIKWGKILKIK